MVVYIDTSAWIALIDPKGKNHVAAKAAQDGLRRSNELLVTGWHTLIELADGLEHHFSQKAAAGTIDRILSSPSVQVEDPIPGHARALDIFRTSTDWKVDLSDCLSFALMETHQIRRAFTYDRDFLKPGFELVG